MADNTDRLANLEADREAQLIARRVEAAVVALQDLGWGEQPALEMTKALAQGGYFS